MTKSQSTISWALRIVAAAIMLQTLYFKFTGHPDSVELFDTVGIGDAGRIGTGVVELIAGILLLIPKTVWLGAGLSLGVISGAIMSHLTILGINYNGDGGGLFALAVVVFLASLGVLWIHRKEIPFLNL